MVKITCTTVIFVPRVWTAACGDGILGLGVSGGREEKLSWRAQGAAAGSCCCPARVRTLNPSPASSFPTTSFPGPHCACWLLPHSCPLGAAFLFRSVPSWPSSCGPAKHKQGLAPLGSLYRACRLCKLISFPTPNVCAPHPSWLLQPKSSTWDCEGSKGPQQQERDTRVDKREAPHKH